MEPSQDFKSLQESVQKSLISTVKTVNRLAAEDLSFQRTVKPEVAQQLEDRSARILDLSTRLLRSAGRLCTSRAPKLEDVDDIEMNWRGIVDVVDTVLEKADTALDEYTGLVKRKEPPVPDSSSKAKKPKVIRNANISKPQALFEKETDNFPTSPWKPILTSKPNAEKPLEESLVLVPNETGTPQFQHPYETEISHMKYPKRVYETADPIPYQPVEGTQAIFVDTFEGVLEMLEELKKAKEIAVDLEHHDFRTYVGLVSLMQVSTREQDWIVDTLQPWRHKLEVLNQVFTDPSIIKVFHGAYMDMIWLQRDLGLYVNGLFDTFFGCDLLYSGRSLAFLLSKFVDFDADKQYQLADWRIRPLPEEMLYYARSDTHYLLYIYDRVRNDLVAASDASDPEKNLIERALQKSRELSLSRHEHPGYDEESGEGPRGWYGYVFKNSHLAFNSEQFAVFKALWKWRDEIARKEDENPNFVLSTGSIADIARINPPDAKALHSLLPLTASLARPQFNDIWAKVKEAKAKGGPSLLHFFTQMAPDDIRKHRRQPAAGQATRLPDIDGKVTVGRLTRSQLFGDMPISSRWEENQIIGDNQEDTIPFPWQRFIHEGADKGSDQGEPTEENTVMEALPVVVENVASNGENQIIPDEEFTLKRGQKRKSEAVEEESSSSEEESEEVKEDEDMEDEIGRISIEDETQKSKKDRKRERKAAKEALAEEERLKKQEFKKARKERQQEKKANERKEQEQFNAVPFDYSKASSVLHAQRASTGGEAGGNGKKKKKQQPVFDPYSKSADRPVKGARKAPPIKGERTATFKK
ncbi:ribonuclease H-like domain-containing protein [Mariannaea sp. PMI_226]|nr:ribonuclease H-like domain-containing protein [Mariannaea sp. PMI_226]